MDCEDVNMINLFSEEDLIREFEGFGVNIDTTNRSLVDRLKRLCLINDLTPETLACEWMAFCSNRRIESTLAENMLEIFETRKFRNQVKELGEREKEMQFSKNRQSMMSSSSMNADLFDEYGLDGLKKLVVKTEEDLERSDMNREFELLEAQLKSNEAAKTISQIKTTQDVQMADESKNVTSKEKEEESIQKLPDKQIDCEYGCPITKEDLWKNLPKSDFKPMFKPLNPSLHITKPFKYLQIRRHESNSILNEPIDEMADKILSKLDIAGFANMNEREKSDQYYVGRITADAKDGKLTNRSLYFESPGRGDGHVKLDLSRVSNYSLFPGKIIALNGYFDEDYLVVKDIIRDNLNVPEVNSSPVTLKAPLHLVVACGPYTSHDSQNLGQLANLLDYVKTHQPHYLILMGPFFDCRSDFLLANCDCEQFFQVTMEAVSVAIRDTLTKVIVIPSTFDLNSYSTFPAPPFEYACPNIQFMPNPSLLVIEGVVISLSSVDVIRHLLSESVEQGNEDGSGRVKRMCSQLLSQRSLYPLYPPNPEVNLEFSKLDFVRFNVAPHLLILPSVIKSFVTDAYSSIFINPGFISKGQFARIRLQVPDTEFVGPLKEHISIELIKQ